ncbi:LuxR family transcriptional regulator [Shinella sp. 838]|uniref:LuxR family transcriptional regulator n=1 Tax=Shinella sp. 838 TaxID=3038164 RepID=UPI0024154149|nr:LuxR family transcriptional regulator [Shinella sp. 838]MDG4674732.1 LuxR family transcriptional regulator [Shinella sp. 838]
MHTHESALFRITFAGIEAASTVAEAIEVVQANYGIDYVTYHLAQTVAGIVDAPFVRTTYPDPWVARYLVKDFVKVDPILHEGLVRQLPFDWRDVEIPEAALEFYADAKTFGLGENGFSIPVVTKSRRALFSLNSRKPDSEWSAFVAERRKEWVELAFLIHKKAVRELYGEDDPVPLLGGREVECLHWASLGKEAPQIAAILGLSEHTVRSYLKSAQLKLGCATRSAATARAAQLRLINPYGNTHT